MSSARRTGSSARQKGASAFTSGGSARQGTSARQGSSARQGTSAKPSSSSRSRPNTSSAVSPKRAPTASTRSHASSTSSKPTGSRTAPRQKQDRRRSGDHVGGPPQQSLMDIVRKRFVNDVFLSAASKCIRGMFLKKILLPSFCGCHYRID